MINGHSVVHGDADGPFVLLQVDDLLAGYGFRALVAPGRTRAWNPL